MDENIITSNPKEEQAWYDIVNQKLKVYNGKEWVIVNPCVAFEDYIPSLRDLEAMCKEYPGLEKAYENFKTVYRMVETDWHKKQKRDRL